MPIDDVWRDYERRLEVFWFDTFENIPISPGVYAWFYPLRVNSLDMTRVLAEFRSVHLFDARGAGKPRVSGSGRLGWNHVNWSLELDNPSLSVSKALEDSWEKIVSDPDSVEFEYLRTALLAASLLTSPLYIGKAQNLRRRCATHLHGGSDFARRFEKHAEELGLHSKRVQDLVLVTVRTNLPRNETSIQTFEEDLIETILNAVARPPYGVI